jgi:hypothetical protein
VLGEVLVHLEHADLVLASEHRLKLLVGHDLALVLRVLELVLLDVLPTTSGRGKGAEPTMAANSSEGCNGLRKAEVAFLPSLWSAFSCSDFSGVEGGM